MLEDGTALTQNESDSVSVKIPPELEREQRSQQNASSNRPESPLKQNIHIGKIGSVITFKDKINSLRFDRYIPNASTKQQSRIEITDGIVTIQSNTSSSSPDNTSAAMKDSNEQTYSQQKIYRGSNIKINDSEVNISPASDLPHHHLLITDEDSIKNGLDVTIQGEIIGAEHLLDRNVGHVVTAEKSCGNICLTGDITITPQCSY